MAKYANQEQSRLIRSGFFNRKVFREDARSTLLLTTGTTGLLLYLEDYEMADPPCPGTELFLKREADRDPYRWTVGVYLDEDTKLGYIIEFKRETIARLMDYGYSLRAVAVNSPSEEEVKRLKRKYNRPIEEWSLTFDVFWEEPVDDSTHLTKREPILILQTAIEEMDKYISFEEYEDRLKPGTELYLYRDLNHEYDEWAIGVFLDKDTQIGCVSPYKDDCLAHLLDEGRTLHAYINEPIIEYMTEPQYGFGQVPVGLEPKEDWRVPFAVYLE